MGSHPRQTDMTFAIENYLPQGNMWYVFVFYPLKIDIFACTASTSHIHNHLIPTDNGCIILRFPFSEWTCYIKTFIVHRPWAHTFSDGEPVKAFSIHCARMWLLTLKLNNLRCCRAGTHFSENIPLFRIWSAHDHNQKDWFKATFLLDWKESSSFVLIVCLHRHQSWLVCFDYLLVRLVN